MALAPVGLRWLWYTGSEWLHDRQRYGGGAACKKAHRLSSGECAYDLAGRIVRWIVWLVLVGRQRIFGEITPRRKDARD